MAGLGGSSLRARHGTPLTVLGQFGHRVSAGQFIRHGSAERGQPRFRRQRSRDRINPRNQSLPPVPNFEPAGEFQASEWTEEILDLKEKSGFSRLALANRPQTSLLLSRNLWPIRA